MLVQFGKKWIQRIPRTAELDSAYGLNLAVLGIFLIQLFPNWTTCSPITYTKTIWSQQILTSEGKANFLCARSKRVLGADQYVG